MFQLGIWKCGRRAVEIIGHDKSVLLRGSLSVWQEVTMRRPVHLRVMSGLSPESDRWEFCPAAAKEPGCGAGS
jgi:hypothetical protein